MEHYRVAVGISPPFRFLSRSKRRSMSHSARSMPGTLPSGFQAARTPLRRSPSAPPVRHPKGQSWGPSRSQLGTRPHSSTDSAKLSTRANDLRSVTIEVPTNEMLGGSRIASKAASAFSGYAVNHSVKMCCLTRALHIPFKDDFQSVLRSLSTLMFLNIISSHSMECESMLLVTNHIPYL